PSTIDLWDLKPDHANGGEFKPIKTNADGVQISEHLPQLATVADHMAIVRSMTGKEGDHGRAAYQVRTGYLPQEPLKYPQFGSVIAKELGGEECNLPPCVSIAVAGRDRFLPDSFNAGYLGAMYSPLMIGESVFAPSTDVNKALRVPDLALPEGVN